MTFVNIIILTYLKLIIQCSNIKKLYPVMYRPPSVSVKYETTQTWKKFSCLDIYVDIFDKIKAVIKKFNDIEHNNLEKCENILNIVKNKENELKECYENELLDIYLISSEDINTLYEKCKLNFNSFSNFSFPTYASEALKRETENLSGIERNHENEMPLIEVKGEDDTQFENNLYSKGQDSLQSGQRSAKLEIAEREEVKPRSQRVVGTSDSFERVRDGVSGADNYNLVIHGNDDSDGKDSADKFPTDIPNEHKGVHYGTDIFVIPNGKLSFDDTSVNKEADAISIYTTQSDSQESTKKVTVENSFYFKIGEFLEGNEKIHTRGNSIYNHSKPGNKGNKERKHRERVIPLLIYAHIYAPLMTFSKKKKRKNRKPMSERLQKILFGPSFKRERKNVPFSYSPFEY
ncbi:variable surface protein [Plasmodium gonderi]|uniref:Variable surface protein n=1 Tax=Plasmodium gonderi TaxID=77519 RepID=A0A1Y1JT99_PLAGO|nr:variable surface protein [Plasmodium gonderi]GAW84002.1 variable surface protein [Plasmodium gonderi]